jgi:hypothetical protein
MLKLDFGAHLHHQNLTSTLNYAASKIYLSMLYICQNQHHVANTAAVVAAAAAAYTSRGRAAAGRGAGAAT